MVQSAYQVKKNQQSIRAKENTWLSRLKEPTNYQGEMNQMHVVMSINNEMDNGVKIKGGKCFICKR